MVHNFTGRGGRQYRYYTCTRAIKSGRNACPSAYLPAAEIERVVVERIRAIAEDRDIAVEVVRQARALAEAELNGLRMEQSGLERELVRHHAELRNLATKGSTEGGGIVRVVELQEAVTRAESRLAEVRNGIANREAEQFSDEEFAAAFREFDNAWNALSPHEQTQALSLLLSRIEFDATDSSITMTFHPVGIKSLATDRGEEAA
jgi:site-specific DNA recombinase